MPVQIDLATLARSGLAGAALFVLFAGLEAALPGGRRDGTGLGRLALNLTMPLLATALTILVPFSTTIAAGIAEAQGTGLFQVVEAPAALVLAAALIFRTFLAYWVHRLSHRWPALWRIHRVHHSDPAFDLSLALRHHPFEALIAIAVYGAAALALGLPVWAALTVDTILVAAAFWEHIDADAPRAFRRLDHWVTTPDWHRVHHSAAQPETDSNYGSLTSAWDRLFGTYREPCPGLPERIGLGPASDRLAHNWAALIASPFAADSHWSSTSEPAAEGGALSNRTNRR